jgi:pimeloyl-ACP methyl ester carboxylesterase
VPTLIVVGDEDTLTPPAASEDMHRAIAGSEIVRIRKPDISAASSSPELFNAALAAFLSHRV